MNLKRLRPLALFIAFLLLCMSVAYWAMQFFKPPVRNVVVPVAVTRVDAPLAAATGLLGGGTGSAVVASNFQLRGVVVAANARDSVAIISADGKPAQAVWVDSELQPGVTIKEVHRQYVLLSEGGVMRRVELPQPSATARADAIAPGLPPPAPQPDFNPGMQQQAPPPPAPAPANIGPGTGPRPTS